MALFYVHPFPVDMSYLVHCPSSRIAQRVSEYGEVQAYRALRNDVRRTRNASLATFFYMPIWEWTSVRSGACNGTTHRERMNAVAKYLSESALYRRFASRHFWLTSAAQASAIDTAIASERGDLQNRLYDLFDVLKPAIAGERKVMRKLTSTASKAVFEIPYGTPSVRRPELYFAGSFDVCCTGARLRCKLATLSSHPAFRLLSTPRANSTPGRCGANVPACRTMCEENMRQHTFCLVVAGDTAVTARLYTVISKGCIPVIVAPVKGAFHSRVDYESFSVVVKPSDFLRNPKEALLDRVANITTERRVEMQKKLVDAQEDVLWSGSRVASNVLATLESMVRSAPSRPA